MKKILQSKIIWRLTGLTYATAIIATNGRYVTKDKYIDIAKDEMKVFLPFFSKKKTVLEFGCGPGKNLFSISNVIKTGYGIDINDGYIRLANKLAKKYNYDNIHFVPYNGSDFPDIPKVDVIFEKGVFERLNDEMVKIYIKKLKEYLNENGIIIIYFLMEKAMNTEFTKRLGNMAYFFWNHNKIENVLKSNNLATKEVINGQYADYYVCEKI